MGSSAVKAPLRWVIRFAILHPLSSIALVVLVGVSLFFAAGRVPPPFAAHASTAATTANMASTVMPKGNLPAPVATEAFMNGQANYNADLVWESLSNDLHDSLAIQGATKDTIQEQLDQYKQQGRQMDGITYVGGYTSAQKSYYFYVAAISASSGSPAEPVFFAFTLDNDGKILMVE